MKKACLKKGSTLQCDTGRASIESSLFEGRLWLAVDGTVENKIRLTAREARLFARRLLRAADQIGGAR